MLWFSSQSKHFYLSRGQIQPVVGRLLVMCVIQGMHKEERHFALYFQLFVSCWMFVWTRFSDIFRPFSVFFKMTVYQYGTGPSSEWSYVRNAWSASKTPPRSAWGGSRPSSSVSLCSRPSSSVSNKSKPLVYISSSCFTILQSHFLNIFSTCSQHFFHVPRIK